MDTFVVRIWRRSPSGERSRRGLESINGVVEHVATGRSSAFRGVAELGALMLSGPEWPAGQDDPDPLLDARRTSAGPGATEDESHGLP